MLITPAGKIDRSAVMSLAWAKYYDVSVSPVSISRHLKKGFRANADRWSNCLKSAWANARYELAQSRKTPEQRRADALAKIESQILDLQMIDTLAHRDTSRLPLLRELRHQAEALRAEGQPVRRSEDEPVRRASRQEIPDMGVTVLWAELRPAPPRYPF